MVPVGAEHRLVVIIIIVIVSSPQGGATCPSGGEDRGGQGRGS